MKTIPLTKGKVALVDDHWFDRLSKYKWQALKAGKKGGREFWYARRMTSLKDGPRRGVFMHREVSGAPVGTLVNHRDFDGLNNRESNLEACSYSENNRYRRKTIKATHSRYKGVTWNCQAKRWQSNIKKAGKTYFLGYFDEEVDAAYAYNNGASYLFGDHAMLNDLP